MESFRRHERHQPVGGKIKAPWKERNPKATARLEAEGVIDDMTEREAERRAGLRD